jgi:starch synthase
MRVDLLTREYPPASYGGAGTHVDHLVRHLRRKVRMQVHCFGEPRGEDYVSAYDVPQDFPATQIALRTAAINSAMAAGVAGASAVHSHTWYANFAGHLAKIMYGIPHVVTTHSLERCRPWKTEQLQNGYALSSFYERTALLDADRILAVSEAMRADILRYHPEIPPERVAVIYSGVDADEFQPTDATDELEPHGIRADVATVACVARITPQKGLLHLLRAAEYFRDGTQVVVVAQTWDTPGHRQEFADAVTEARRSGVDVRWISGQLSRRALVQLISHARVFACPSVYEPMGIVNLEAMACATSVVASDTGGIPEVVLDGDTGFLVPMATDGLHADPVDPHRFARDFATRVNELLCDPALAQRMGEEGRRRVLSCFTWEAAADRVLDAYISVTA